MQPRAILFDFYVTPGLQCRQKNKKEIENSHLLYEKFFKKNVNFWQNYL